jgi:hypothetical protein
VTHIVGRKGRAFLLAFVFVVAPLGALVLITALLLFGVRPGLVFAPGHGVMRLVAMLGHRAPNAVGVITTAACWWLVIVVAGLAWDRRRR